jgi:hypothetical protein
MIVEAKVKGSCAGAESAFFVDGGAKGFLVGSEVNSLIRTKGSPIGILEGSAKGPLVRVKDGSLAEAEGFPGGSLVGAGVSSLVRAIFVGAGSGGSSLASDGTVGISFGTSLMFTSRNSLWLACSLSIDSMWLILRLAIFLWATRAVGSLVGADGPSREEGTECCAGSFSGKAAGSSGIRGGSLGNGSSGIRGGSLGKAIGSSFGEGTGSFFGKAMGSSFGEGTGSLSFL